MTLIEEHYKKYFDDYPPGSVIPWAEGTLTKCEPDIAIHKGPDGATMLERTSNLEMLYSKTPAIKRAWDASYGAPPFPMAATFKPYQYETTDMHDDDFFRLICTPGTEWCHPNFFVALQLAARITAGKFPLTADRKDPKLCVMQGCSQMGQPEAGSHGESGEVVDIGYYCKAGAELNYTQYCVSGGPLPTQIWDDGFVLNSRFDPERNAYFVKALLVICPDMTGIFDYELKTKCGLTKDWIRGDSRNSAMHYLHAHLEWGRKVDDRFAKMIFYDANEYINREVAKF